jgi:pyruvate dehydrogenase E1 component alpha subunit
MAENKSIYLQLDAAKGQSLFYQMLLMRRFEEKSAEMYTKSKIRGFLHLYIGEEAVATGVIEALHDDDPVLSTYREHGHALARGLSPGSIMAEMYGKVEGCCMGRGGSMHLFDVSKKFYGGNAIVCGHLPMAVGMALAIKKQNKKQLVCCFFGEGAAAEGEFHEAMNLAALWKVPVLFVCENNYYAMGTAIRYSHSVQEIEKKGPAYGVESAAVNGMSLLSVLKAARVAVEKVRSTGNPYLLVCNTYRFRAHSMFDAELYRDKEEVETWKKRDPIPEFQEYLLAKNLITHQEIKALENRIKKEVQEAVDFAEAGSFEPVEDLTKFTYSQP